MPKISRIHIYPVKGLPGVDVTTATLTANGALAHDREFAITDASGNFVNGKRNADIHKLDVSWSIRQGAISLRLNNPADPEIHALHGPSLDALEQILSRHFGKPVRLVRHAEGGFPDDNDSPGPTIASEASHAEVARWFPGLSLEESRSRFRSNIEIDDCPPFWEDRLYGEKGIPVRFRLGEALFLGINPCLRCVVPTRNPASGEEWRGFQRRFAERRRETLPSWATRSQFDYFYRFAVNTRAGENLLGKMIRVGDPVILD